MRRVAWAVVAGIAVSGAAFAIFETFKAQPVTGLMMADDRMLAAQGADLYVAHCAACHGADLEGEPNWRQRLDDGRLPAPPHDASGHTWHHDSEALFQLINYGVANLIGDPDYESNMPAYEGVLSDPEIVAVLTYIKSTWPQDIRDRYDAAERD